MDFVSFASHNGLNINNLDDSGDIVRVSTTEKPSAKNGSYSWDGYHGWVQNWNRHDKPVYYETSHIKKLTSDEQKKLNEKRIEIEKNREFNHHIAKTHIIRKIKEGKIDSHPYLRSKGLTDKCLVDGVNLVIPIYDYRSYEPSGYQNIYWGGDSYIKKMATGTKARGGIHTIGDRSAQSYILCEGFATGLSISKAIKSSGMNMAVVVCFSASNVAFMGRRLKSRPGYVYADNDENGTGENSAKCSGLKYCISKKVGNDANDDMRDFGIQYVINNIKSLL